MPRFRILHASDLHFSVTPFRYGLTDCLGSWLTVRKKVSGPNYYDFINRNNWVLTPFSLVSVSPQGIDNQGQAVVDVVNSSGQAWEYHDQVGWVYLGSGIKSAMAGQGVSYVLSANGTVSEYNDATGKWSTIYTGAAQIDAGTDAHGVNAVDIVFTGGNAWEYSDDTGWHFIASNVASVSAGRQGNSCYVTTAGVAHWHDEVGNQDSAGNSNVRLALAGTDPNGNLMVDLLFADGNVSEYRLGIGWKDTVAEVASITKGRLGAVDVVFTYGNAWECTATLMSPFLGNYSVAV